MFGTLSTCERTRSASWTKKKKPRSLQRPHKSFSLLVRDSESSGNARSILTLEISSRGCVKHQYTETERFKKLTFEVSPSRGRPSVYDATTLVNHVPLPRPFISKFPAQHLLLSKNRGAVWHDSGRSYPLPRRLCPIESYFSYTAGIFV